MMTSPGERAYSIIFAGVFFALGVMMAFSPVWLEAHGYSGEFIGWIVTAVSAARIASSFGAPAAAEKLHAPIGVALALCAFGAVCALAHLPEPGQIVVIIAQIGVGVALFGLLPLIEAHAYGVAVRDGFSYARARIIGSFAFIAATVSVGALVDVFGHDVIMLAIAAAFAVAGFGAVRAPVLARRAAHEVGGFQALASRPVLVAFILAIAVVQASHAGFYIYCSVLWRAEGYSETVIGLLWGWGVLAEILLFSYGRPIIAWLGAERALAIAAAVAVGRWLGMALLTGPAELVFLQAMHAGSFALTHLAMLELVRSRTSAAAAPTIQGAASSLAGLASVGASALAATAYGSGAAAVYLVSAAIAALGLSLVLASAAWSAKRGAVL